MSVLNQKTIKLNVAWQVIGETSVEEAIKMMFAGAATGMVVDGDSCYPVPVEEWVKLPLRDGIDVGIHTPKIVIREPRVIVAINYAKIPKVRPKLNLRGVMQRDQNRCQYTGRVLSREEATLDHVLPRSRGGRDEWGNLVLCDKELNNKKGDKTPEEAGLKLLRKPSAPRELPPSVVIRPTHPDHELFLFR